MAISPSIANPAGEAHSPSNYEQQGTTGRGRKDALRHRERRPGDDGLLRRAGI